MDSLVSARVTLWVNRFLALAVAGMAFALPGLLDWYAGVRQLGPFGGEAITAAYYICCPVVLYALWCIEGLMGNILAERVFVEDNVRRIRRLRWCCVGVSLVCLPAAWFYQPLIFLVVIMAFLALIVSVVKSVIAAAVELREENDLTI